MRAVWEEGLETSPTERKGRALTPVVQLIPPFPHASSLVHRRNTRRVFGDLLGGMVLRVHSDGVKGGVARMVGASVESMSVVSAV